MAENLEFHDIEELYETDKEGKKELNKYFEGFLPEEAAQRLVGYELAIESLKENYAYYIYKHDPEIFSFTSLDMQKLDLNKLHDYIYTEYDPMYNGDTEEIAKLNDETRTAMIFYRQALISIYAEKNMHGMTSTNQTDPHVIAENAQAYLQGTYKNAIIRYKEAKNKK